MRSFLLGSALLLFGVVSAEATEFYANRTLRVGTILSDVDIRVSGEKSAEVGTAIVGMEVRRAVYVGHQITMSDVGPPTLVRRNEVVVMTYRQGALNLRAEGRALGAGGQGEVIDVMNLASRQTIRAIVSGRRAVEIRR